MSITNEKKEQNLPARGARYKNNFLYIVIIIIYRRINNWLTG